MSKRSSLKLPIWIPVVRRPWNPEWAETWDHMTDNEKRWSFVVAAVIAVIFFVFIIGIGL